VTFLLFHFFHAILLVFYYIHTMDEHREKILVVFVLNHGNVSSHYFFIPKNYHSIQVLDLKEKSFQKNYHKKT